MENAPQQKSGHIIKVFYFYMVSIIALFMVIFSLADMVNIALRTYVFTKADSSYYPYVPEMLCPVTSTPTVKGGPCVTREEQDKINAESRSAQRQRDLVRDISFLIVGIPLFSYHWIIVRRKDI